MKTSITPANSLIAALAVLIVTGCVSNPPQSEKTEAAPAASTNKADAKEQPKATPAASATPGTRTVKGINDWEGEITGQPAANSKFKTLQIGMSMKQATDIAGQPTDQGAYVTGKAWIPFYFGADRHRYELVFKGQGRLIFAGGSMHNYSGGNLIMIIHNDKESGYR
ncbi:MAG: hypothetical protein HY777_13575 [Betaproteobacteria bacterium]|nr:hypothetical protein [Betaproteobacteria bacterium]